MHDVVLLVHIAAGVLGLAAAPVAALSRKAQGLHTAAGWAYQACTGALCSTTFVLVALDPSLWPFVPIAVGTQAAATAGVVVRRRRRPGWVPLHVQLLLGSYVSFVTAFTVNTVGGLAGWLVPVTVGSAVVAVVTARVTRAQQRPARQGPAGPPATAASASGSVNAPA